tara:strand:- start:889 stop:1821 length:933 start_codon:yes stop_codon:yes gene_type:complete
MPLPSPNDKEKRSDFITRCVADLSTKGEFKGNDQRVAVCISQFEKASKKASLSVGNEFLDGKGPWNDKDLFFIYNTPQTKMSEARDKKMSKDKKMDEEEGKVFKSYMSHCVMNDAEMVDTKDMNMDNTMKACAVQYDKDRPMLMENSNGELTEKQKKLPPALQKAILKKMKEENKAHHYGKKKETKASIGRPYPELDKRLEESLKAMDMENKDKKMKAMDKPKTEEDEKMKAMDMPKKDEKMKMRAAEDPMAHGHPTAKKAMEEGKKLGLTGVHLHRGKDGKPVYMPGRNHEEFMKRHDQLLKEKKNANK